MKEFELVFYRKANGDCPVSDFLSSLNKEMRFKLMHSLDLLELYGNKPKGDFTKFVKDGIFEVRAQNKTDITRVMFFFDKNRKIVLTHGFIKKTQRMPMSEYDTAARYRADYFAREAEREAKAAKSAPDHYTNGPKWRPKLDDIVLEAQSKGNFQYNLSGKRKDSRGR